MKNRKTNVQIFGQAFSKIVCDCDIMAASTDQASLTEKIPFYVSMMLNSAFPLTAKP